MIKLLFTQLLEIAINKLNSLNPEINKILRTHQGKVLLLELTQLSQTCYFFVQNEHLYVYSTFDGHPDTVIRGSLLAFLKQAVLSHSIEKDLIIEGDVEFAQDIRCLLQNLGIDWEEWISYITGDIVAHHLGVTIKKLKKTSSTWLQRFSQDTLEYLQEEKKLLPVREEIEDFYEEISILRNDVARLEALLARFLNGKSAMQ